MDENEIKKLVETQVEAMILKAFRSEPEVVEALVRTALGQTVTEYGFPPDKKGGFGHDKEMPFLDYLVGQTIRNAAQRAIMKVMEEREPQIEAAVRKSLDEGAVADAMTKKLVNIMSNKDFKIEVSVGEEKKERY